MKANLRYWTSVLGEAERDLEAATTRTALNVASRKLMEAKRELKRLQAVVVEGGCRRGLAPPRPEMLGERPESLP